MEPSSNSNLPPDKAAAQQHSQQQQHPTYHPHHNSQKQQQQHHFSASSTSSSHHHPQPPRSVVPSTSSSASSGISAAASSSASPAPGQAAIEKLCRPAAFDKMESLVREMQDTECGVPVRSQKLFLTSIPSAFMGYDLIEWLMERLSIEESEALNIANQLCLLGYFFPVNDGKNLVVKDDSSLYRFQTPYFWPWQHKAPDNVEYAIYLTKRSLRNKQRHGLEEYEMDAMNSLHRNLKGKWDFITIQAEEQVKLCKERKKGDKIVSDSQEKAYWRVHRPPPGQFTPLEPCPVPTRDKKQRKRTVEDAQKEVDFLNKSSAMTRVKMSQACELLIQYFEVFSEYDPLMQPALPSNPWVTEDTTFWSLNSALVEMPTEKRVKRWSISIEELVSDPTGLQEFTNYLKKEYSHENIRFWTAVNDLRRSAHSQIAKKVREIYEEFLEPGAPCEINIDGKTMEKVQHGLKNPTRFTFDAAGDHIYALLLKKDCYPRFIRSEHYKVLLATGIQPAHKKRFFGFGGVAKKKSSATAPPNAALMAQSSASSSGQPGGLGRRRGSDRSLTGSAHELAVSGVKDASTKVQHSHSQSNLCDIPYRESVKALEVHSESSASCSVCPWDTVEPTTAAAVAATSNQIEAPVSVSICPWEDDTKSPPPPQPRIPIYLEKASDIGEVSERMKRVCGIRQSTLDSDFHSTKNLMPDVSTQRRASITITPRISEYHALSSSSNPPSATSSVHHVASVPGIFSLNTLPVHEAGNTRQSQQSLDSSVSLDDGSVSAAPQPEAMMTVHQDSLPADEVTDIEVDEEIATVHHQQQQQQPPAIHVQEEEEGGVEGAMELCSVVVSEECCDCDDENAQTLISTNSGSSAVTNNVNNNINNINNSAKITIINVQEEQGKARGVDATTTATSSCCCDPIAIDNVVVVAMNAGSGRDSVLYGSKGDAAAEEEQKEDNINNPVIGSDLRGDNQQRSSASPSATTTPSIRISASASTSGGGPQLKREASIEGDEFMMQSRTASEEQKSESPQATTTVPAGPSNSISTSDEACESCKAEQEAAARGDESHRKQPINQSQRQSTDVQSSDLEFEDVPEDGTRFLLRGCVAPAPTPAPMIAPLAEVEQDPQDEDFDEEEDDGEEEEDDEGDGGADGGGAYVALTEENEGVVSCDKLQQQEPDQSSAPSASGLEKQQSNESEVSAKTPPPELFSTLSEANKRDMVEPIPVYACKPTTTEGGGQGGSSSRKSEDPGTKKRRKKRDPSGVKAVVSGSGAAAEGGTKDDGSRPGGSETEPKGNPVCPWDDDDVSSSVEVNFVKTYATLGYL